MTMRWFLWIGLWSISLFCEAQTTYTDSNPNYRPWQPEYTIDKIVYTADVTILHCSWTCDNATIDRIVLPTPQQPSAWYLEDLDSGERTPMRIVKNIQRNRVLIMETFGDYPLEISTAGRTGTTLFHFEIHFPPMDGSIRHADLIAGQGNRYGLRHFNCFEVALKSWDHPADEGVPSSTAPIYEAEPMPLAATPDSGAVVVSTTTMPVADTATAPVAAVLPYRATGDLWSPEGPPCGQPLILKDIQFLDDQAVLQGERAARRTLQGVVDYLQAHPKVKATLYGHTDVFGDADRNWTLSEERALVIQRLLLQAGISEQRLSCRWFGPTQPLDPSGDARNRRVEIQLQCP